MGSCVSQAPPRHPRTLLEVLGELESIHDDALFATYASQAYSNFIVLSNLDEKEKVHLTRLIHQMHLHAMGLLQAQTDHRAQILSLLCAIELVGLRRALSPVHPTPQESIEASSGLLTTHQAAYIPGAF